MVSAKTGIVWIFVCWKASCLHKVILSLSGFWLKCSDYMFAPSKYYHWFTRDTWLYERSFGLRNVLPLRIWNESMTSITTQIFMEFKMECNKFKSIGSTKWTMLSFFSWSTSGKAVSGLVCSRLDFFYFRWSLIIFWPYWLRFNVIKVNNKND